MIKLILKIAIVYVILQYGFKVDINGYLKPYIEPLWHETQAQLPDAAKQLIDHAEENLPALTEKLRDSAESTSDNPLANYVKDRATALDDAKASVEALEKKMKEMQEAADKAAQGGN